MATIGRLAVVLNLDSQGFAKGLKSAQIQVSRSARDMRRRLNRITMRQASISVAAFGTSMALLTKHFIKAADEAERFEIALKKTLGSVEEGSKLFNWMAKYAATVSHEYRDLLAASVTLSGILKGGADEVIKWMPLLGDLGAFAQTLGITMQETTSQIVRFFSSGAAAADLFREKGILALLGFKAGVHYTVEETKAILLKAWKDPASKFRGLATELTKSWTGLMSMMADAWFQARNQLMKSGLFEMLKRGLASFTDKLNEMVKQGAFTKLGNWIQIQLLSIQMLITYIEKYAHAVIGTGSVLFKFAVRDFEGMRANWKTLNTILDQWDQKINKIRTSIIDLKAKQLTGAISSVSGEGGGGRRTNLPSGGVTAPVIGIPGTRTRTELWGAPAMAGGAYKGLLDLDKLPKTLAQSWSSAMETVRDNMQSTQSQFVSFAYNVQWGWENTIQGLMSGTVSFRNFAQRMFADILNSFTRMISQMAAQKLYKSIVPAFTNLIGFVGGLDIGGGGNMSEMGDWNLGTTTSASTARPVNITIIGQDAETINSIVDENIRRQGHLKRRLS